MQRARRGDLAVGRRAAAILGDDRIDAVALEQGAILRLAERPARGQIDRLRHGKRRIDGIDASHQIKMLRRGDERRELLPSEREEYAARRLAESLNRPLHCLDLDPMIAGDARPGRTPQRQQLHVRRASGLGGIGGDGGGIGMRRVDQRVDALAAQIFGEALGAAEPADANRHGLRQRLRRAAGERQGHGEIVAGGEDARQFPAPPPCRQG